MARNEAFGKVVVEVPNPRQSKLLERLLQLRSDAVERLRLGEKRVEDIGPHRGIALGYRGAGA
jgi:hypothetical protein